MDSRLHILQHSLGLDEYGQGRAYRNHFVTSPGTTDWPDCCALVDAGLMKRHPPSTLTGGGYCFTVTEAGRAHVTNHSPKPPKLTRSQKRYREYLASDSFRNFREFLNYEAAVRREMKAAP